MTSQQSFQSGRNGGKLKRGNYGRGKNLVTKFWTEIQEMDAARVERRIEVLRKKSPRNKKARSLLQQIDREGARIAWLAGLRAARAEMEREGLRVCHGRIRLAPNEASVTVSLYIGPNAPALDPPGV